MKIVKTLFAMSAAALTLFNAGLYGAVAPRSAPHPGALAGDPLAISVCVQKSIETII